MFGDSCSSRGDPFFYYASLALQSYCAEVLKCCYTITFENEAFKCDSYFAGKCCMGATPPVHWILLLPILGQGRVRGPSGDKCPGLS